MQRIIFRFVLISSFCLQFNFLRPALAEEQGPLSGDQQELSKNWYLSNQLLIPSLSSYSNQNDGSSGMRLAPYWMLGVAFDQISWDIQILLSPFGTGGMADVYRKQSLFLRSDYILPIWDMALKLGGGLWFDRTSGSGGTVSLNNADTMTTYAIPGRSVIDLEFFLSAGIRAPQWIQNLNLSLEFYERTLFSSRRNLGVALEASYAVF